MGLNFPETMEALGKQRWEDYKDIETKEQGLSKSPRNKQGLNITETVEKVNQQRMQNLMDIEAKELVGFFKVYVHRSTYNLPYSLSQDTVSMTFFYDFKQKCTYLSKKLYCNKIQDFLINSGCL